MQIPERSESTLSIQWLGINAVRFRYKNRVVLLDPYVTRNPKAPSNPEYIKKHIPAADCIVISHSHWDHVADTPALARLTGATVVGSETTVNICRAHGIPDAQLVTLHAGDEYETPDFSLRFLPSRHVLLPTGQVAYAGTYRAPPKLPLRQQDYLEGRTFAPLFQFGRHTVLNLGSANYIAEALDGIRCDPRESVSCQNSTKPSGSAPSIATVLNRLGISAAPCTSGKPKRLTDCRCCRSLPTRPCSGS